MPWVLYFCMLLMVALADPAWVPWAALLGIPFLAYFYRRGQR